MQADLKQKVRQAEAEKASQDQKVTYEINPKVNVNPEQFKAAIASYAELLKGKNMMNLASILLGGISEFEHNHWTFKVKNNIQKGMVEKEKDFLPFLRKKIGVPSLYMSCLLDDSYVNEDDLIPYTDEDKLKAMGEKNPQLVELQRIFKTRIVY
ncbi:MAG: hypothetical protein AAFY71_22995 [Bacteroidota bacterium]